MDLSVVKQALYEKYIAPTKKKRESFIGVEIEMPILNLNKEAVSFAFVQDVTERFLSAFQFEVTGRDDSGYIYAAEQKETGDILSYDCSYNNLELSFGKCRTIHEVWERFEQYYNWLQKAFGERNHALTGMGVNPYRIYNNNVPIENERYRMLFHHLHSADRYKNLPMYFHKYPMYGTFSSASQVQLDVDYEDLIPTIRAFSKIEPIKALLFSNSVLLGENEELVCCRDMFWENSTHGINPHNIGMFTDVPDSVEELQSYIESTSMYCVIRDGRYINFTPIPVMEYFSTPEICGEYYENGAYHKITFNPKLSDLEYLRTFKFEDLTFRGTIEYRSTCCQPIAEAMTLTALQVGLKEKIQELDILMENDHVLYHRGYIASELRNIFVKRKFPSCFSADEVYRLAEKIVRLAEEGLKSRGFGEEKYLEPLYLRIERRQNPAQRMLTDLESGITLESIIRQFGELHPLAERAREEVCEACEENGDEKSNENGRKIKMGYECPCCGSNVDTEGESAKYYICPVCGWENDPYQAKHPEVSGGANAQSLKDARKNWKMEM